jgi:hypothetical protein
MKHAFFFIVVMPIFFIWMVIFSIPLLIGNAIILINDVVGRAFDEFEAWWFEE